MTRPRTSTLGSFADIRPVLDAVLREGELLLELDTPGQATNFRQRCYRFRTLLQDKTRADLAPLIAAGKAAPGTLPESPYDNVLIQIEPDNRTLRFTQRDPARLLSRLRTPDGAAVNLVPEDDLERAARRLAGSLDLD